MQNKYTTILVDSISRGSGGRRQAMMQLILVELRGYCQDTLILMERGPHDYAMRLDERRIIQTIETVLDTVLNLICEDDAHSASGPGQDTGEA